MRSTLRVDKCHPFPHGRQTNELSGVPHQSDGTLGVPRFRAHTSPLGAAWSHCSYDARMTRRPSQSRGIASQTYNAAYTDTAPGHMKSGMSLHTLRLPLSPKLIVVKGVKTFPVGHLGTFLTVIACLGNLPYT